jgi:hypothetical protein
MTRFHQSASIGQGLLFVIMLLAPWARGQESTVSDQHSKDVSSAESAGQHNLTPAEAERTVRKALPSDQTGIFASLTPPLPAQWPPSPQPTVVYFVYRTASLPTGMNLSEVYSPSARVELSLAPGGEPSPEIKRLEFHKLKGAEDGTVHSSTHEEMEQAEVELFRLRGLPSGEASEIIQRAYRAWIQDHPVISKAIRPSFPEFFKWLEEK